MMHTHLCAGATNNHDYDCVEVEEILFEQTILPDRLCVCAKLSGFSGIFEAQPVAQSPP
jgi:hypothetical protein